MTSAIFDVHEHESPAGKPWSENLAREFVMQIVRDADAAYDTEAFWPRHPEDADGDEAGPVHGIYHGAAGTMWAVARLAGEYGIALKHDYPREIARCEATYRADARETDGVVPSYFLGTAGMMLAAYALGGDASILVRLEHELRSNVGNPTCEALWGSPGSALAILLLRERRSIARFDDVLRAIQDEVWATWIMSNDDTSLLWEQDLYGFRRFFTGASHGAIGNLAPLIRAVDLLNAERRRVLFERVPAMLEAYVVRDGDACNWITQSHPASGNRMQWCHGAPGVILGLAAYPNHDPRVERLLAAAGEGIWRAGPVRKGPTLCHGTAGNGYAFLRLAERTGDERWMVRAQTFAMHAIDQVAAWRDAFGMATQSLWTGELGVALYVDSVLRRDPAILSIDAI